MSVLRMDSITPFGTCDALSPNTDILIRPEGRLTPTEVIPFLVNGYDECSSNGHYYAPLVPAMHLLRVIPVIPT